MKITLAFSLLVQFFVASSLAVEKSPSETIAPYLHQNTILVARIQIEKIDLEKGAKTIVATTSLFSPKVAAQIVNGLITLGENLKKLKKQGVTEIYAVFSPTHLTDLEPYLYVPTANGVSKDKVARLMFSGDFHGPTNRAEANRTNYRGPRSFEHCETLGDGVFCGRAKTLEALKEGAISKRTNLKFAFDSVKDRAIQILFVPSNDQRRVIAETMPALPKAFGSLTGKQLVDGFQWAAAGIDIGETSRLDFVVQSKSNADAANMKKLLSVGLATMTKLNPEDSKDVVKKLIPHVADNRVTFSFVQKAGEPGPFDRAISGPIARAQQAAQRSKCRNNLKHLVIAMHNFHEKYYGLPPRSNFDKKGKKLLSWRVFLLPYLDQKDLYNQFHLDEPWDSNHNKKLISKMPDVFACPSTDLKKQGKTNYLAIAHEKAVLAEKTNRRFREITDGTSNTILILEVSKDKAVVWTKPEDFKIDWKNPTKGLGSEHGELFQALMGDGSVRSISNSIDKDTLRALITFAGKEVIDRDKIK